MLRIHAVDTEIRNTAYQPACLFLLCLNNLYTKKPRPSKNEGRGLDSRYHPDSRNTPGTQLMRNVHIRHSLQAILQECSSNGNLNSYLNLKRASSRRPTLSVGKYLSTALNTIYTVRLHKLYINSVNSCISRIIQYIIFVFTAFNLYRYPIILLNT